MSQATPETKGKTFVLEPTTPGTSATLLGGPPMAKYMTFYGVAAIFLFATYAALISIVLPYQVQIIEAARLVAGFAGPADLATLTPEVKAELAKASGASVGLVMSISSFFTLFAQPIIGAISDRFRNRFGRRSVWIVTGAIFGALLMIGLELSTTIAMVAIFWVLVQVTLNIMQAPLNTTIADRVPEDRRGVLSAITGMGSMVGAAIGVFAAGALLSHLGLKTYYVYGIAVVIGAILFVVFSPDRSSRDLEVPQFKTGQFLFGFVKPILDHDFRWTWLARLAMMLGYQGVGTYNLYLLQFYIHDPLPVEKATQLVPVLMLVGMPGMVLAMFLGGKLSDKLHRRKPFVLWASFGVALCLLIPIVFPTFAGLLAYSIIVGFFFGGYMAVDQALFIDVLPDAKEAGKDLGVANVATNIGQAGSPAAIGVLVGAGLGYVAAFWWALAWAVIGGLAIIPIKKVR